MRPTFFYAISLLFLVYGLQLSAQEDRFSKVFYDKDFQAARTSSRATKTSDKGLLLAGDSLLLRIDPSGSKVWHRTYHILNSSVVIRDLVTLADGSFLAVGFSTNLQDQKQNSLLLKISESGNVLWAKSLAFGTIQNRLLSLTKTLDNQIVVVGNTMENKPLYAKMIVAKLTADGELLWSQLYTGLNLQNYGYAIKQKSDSSFVVTGQAAECTPCNYYAFLANISSNGQSIWANKYGFLNKSFDLGIDLSVEADKIVMLMNRALVQTNVTGKIEKVLVADALSFNYYDVQLHTRLLHTSDGGYLIPKGNPYVGSLLKTNQFGQIEWSRKLRLNPADVHEMEPNELTIVGNGPMIGVIVPEDVALPHIGVISTDGQGGENNCSFESSEKATIDSIVASQLQFTSETLGTLVPTAVTVAAVDLVEYDQCVDVLANSSDLPAFHQLSISPNPTHGKITIQSEPKIDKAMVAIYDLNGRKIRQMDEDQYSGEIDLSDLQTGVYLIRITTDTQVGTVKIVKE